MRDQPGAESARGRAQGYPDLQVNDRSLAESEGESVAHVDERHRKHPRGEGAGYEPGN